MAGVGGWIKGVRQSLARSTEQRAMARDVARVGSLWEAAVHAAIRGGATFALLKDEAGDKKCTLENVPPECRDALRFAGFAPLHEGADDIGKLWIGTNPMPWARPEQKLGRISPTHRGPPAQRRRR